MTQSTLWGSQSWLQPAFSRLLSPAPSSASPRDVPAADPLARVLYRRNCAPLTGVETQSIMHISTARIQTWPRRSCSSLSMQPARLSTMSTPTRRLSPPIGRPVPSRHDPNYPMQLHRVKVLIENVLKGSVDEPKISVYYFAFAGALSTTLDLIPGQNQAAMHSVRSHSVLRREPVQGLRRSRVLDLFGISRLPCEIRPSEDLKDVAFTRTIDDPLARSLAAETGWCAVEKSRLKAGCSQDWLPHKAPPPAGGPSTSL
jgi:hypothetical protein